MKKNKMMRLASALLVAVLLTTSAISGTFAKYVTTNTGADSARVAKWGVVITLANEETLKADDLKLFNTKYDSDTNATVVSADVKGDARVVAPGTKGGMSFTVTGTPEVALRLDVEVEEANAIQLPIGTYDLPEGEFANVATSVETTSIYEPVKFYFGTAPLADDAAASSYNLTLDGLKSALQNLSTAKDARLEPNKPLDTTYYIAWQWAYEGTFTDGQFVDEAPYTNAKVVDFLDTFLGNEKSARVESLKFKVTATQVD